MFKDNDRKKYLPEQTMSTNETPIYEELFDIIKDPKKNNLAENTAYKEELAYFRNRCDRMIKELY